MQVRGLQPEGRLQHEAAGRLARVRTEQAHARRVSAQLRALLVELGALRARVRPDQLAAFDARTQRSRDLTLRAIVDYLGEHGARAVPPTSPIRDPATVVASMRALQICGPRSATRLSEHRVVMKINLPYKITKLSICTLMMSVAVCATNVPICRYYRAQLPLVGGRRGEADG